MNSWDILDAWFSNIEVFLIGLHKPDFNFEIFQSTFILTKEFQIFFISIKTALLTDGLSASLNWGFGPFLSHEKKISYWLVHLFQS